MVDTWHRCDDCQTRLGGKMPDGDRCITVMMGTCLECGKEDVRLIPNSDYSWPDGRKAIFD